MKYTSFFLATVAATVICFNTGCKSNDGQKNESAAASESSKPAETLSVPQFNPDTAYIYIQQQVALGPRTPGSDAQKKCADWMLSELRTVVDTVYTQNVHVTGGDGKSLPCFNLIGSIHPNATKRILMLTHWDSRPWADMDTKDKDKPILAADDGGSGVGVLLEMARELKSKGFPADLGVDILFTDVEDYGRTEWGENSYCLGTQYWARHPHVPGYKADFGILLDMVGAKGAQFPIEGISAYYAGDVQQMIWKAAGNSGYSSYFVFGDGGEITDDHVAVNRIAGIKTVDIINLTADEQHPFAHHWHTHADNMDIIDKGTLKAVGQTLLTVVYNTAQPQ